MHRQDNEFTMAQCSGQQEALRARLAVVEVEPGLHAGRGPQGVVVDLVAAAHKRVNGRLRMRCHDVLPQVGVLPGPHIRARRQAVAGVEATPPALILRCKRYGIPVHWQGGDTVALV